MEKEFHRSSPNNFYNKHYKKTITNKTQIQEKFV